MDPFTVPTTYWHRLDDGRVQAGGAPWETEGGVGDEAAFALRRLSFQVGAARGGRKPGFDHAAAP